MIRLLLLLLAVRRDKSQLSVAELEWVFLPKYSYLFLLFVLFSTFYSIFSFCFLFFFWVSGIDLAEN